MTILPQYVLSATLNGHESDVKALVFPNSHTIASVSRDGSSRLWRQNGEDVEGSHLWPSQILYHEKPYLNSITWLEADDQSKLLATFRFFMFDLSLTPGCRPRYFWRSDRLRIRQLAS